MAQVFRPLTLITIILLAVISATPAKADATQVQVGGATGCATCITNTGNTSGGSGDSKTGTDGGSVTVPPTILVTRQAPILEAWGFTLPEAEVRRLIDHFKIAACWTELRRGVSSTKDGRHAVDLGLIDCNGSAKTVSVFAKPGDIDRARVEALLKALAPK